MIEESPPPGNPESPSPALADRKGILSEFQFGDMCATYLIDEETRRVGLRIHPAHLAPLRHREFLTEPEILAMPQRWQPVRAWQVDSLVQVSVAGSVRPWGFAQGRTMRNGGAVEELRFGAQRVERSRVVTVLESPLGFSCEHVLEWSTDAKVLSVQSCFINRCDAPLALEMLSSFSLGGITPFDEAAAPRRLVLHRFRSSWSAEGRLESACLEDLQLERSWSGAAANCERFGQVGSMPVRGWFPTAAIEDVEANVTWAAQLASPGSWQMEVYRRDDFVSFSGGLADREFGHWWKSIGPGECFVAPQAMLTVTSGGLDEACDRLLSGHSELVPEIEEELPIVFNEWCDSWGSPCHQSLMAIANRLRGSGARYLVIDDGWAERRIDSPQQNGDWRVSREAFPHGLRVIADAIRERGLIPGLWFEFEVANEGSDAFMETDHQLQRDGHPIQVGSRRFWDFRDPWVQEFLEEKLIRLLRENRIGYLKIDYNDTIGIGCDGAESLGEGLRQHLAGVCDFFARLGNQLPGLTIEICSSGGHRLEPSLLSLGAMGSFSDAHESPEIPIIAANLHRLVPPRKAQIWAVLRPDDCEKRLVYSLSATFLGRMCLSGNITGLNGAQWQLALEAQRLYQHVAPIIKNGRSRRHGPHQASFRHPTGWQAVARFSATGDEALIVAHSFAGDPPDCASLALPAGPWTISGSFLSGSAGARLRYDRLELSFDGEFSGMVVHLSKRLPY